MYLKLTRFQLQLNSANMFTNCKLADLNVTNVSAVHNVPSQFRMILRSNVLIMTVSVLLSTLH
ncbi:MAG: hypothetical protein ACTS80_02040 [Candidatus Hodgkinia cicadicola]